MPLKMGRNSYDPPKLMGDANFVGVGNFTSIASGVIIDCGFQHRTNFISTYPFSCKFPHKFGRISGYPFTKGDVNIGSDVWIGQDVVIMSGLDIGDGSIIGARAVVTKNIPPYSVAVGVPAKPIKLRFQEEVVKKLLDIKWWDWTDEKVFQEVDLLMSGRIEEFIQKHWRNP